MGRTNLLFMVFSVVLAMVASLAAIPTVQAGLECNCGGKNPYVHCGPCNWVKGDDPKVCNPQHVEGRCNVIHQ
ncbi:MAG: hypothetical protein J3R72DRAFT_244063 [Linnemannia gamsii]|nr:MAG: hypothetical protein J3R72DRAFT_244063 [Linnemannia gamsii]